MNFALFCLARRRIASTCRGFIHDRLWSTCPDVDASNSDNHYEDGKHRVDDGGDNNAASCGKESNESMSSQPGLSVPSVANVLFLVLLSEVREPLAEVVSRVDISQKTKGRHKLTRNHNMVKIVIKLAASFRLKSLKTIIVRTFFQIVQISFNKICLDNRK